MKKLIVMMALLIILPVTSTASDNGCKLKYREIRANAMISGKLKDKQDIDYYKVTLKREGKLTASVRKLRSATVEILDGLCFNIPERGSLTSKAATLGPGDWFVKVYSPQRITGKYDLYVRFKPGEREEDMEPLMGSSALPEPDSGDDHSNDCGHTTEVFMESTATGVFHDAKDIDVFHILLARPTSLTVWTKGKADTRGILKDSFCNPVAADSKSGINKNFMLKANLEPGKYFISVNRESGNIKEYELLVRGKRFIPREKVQKPLSPLDLTGKWKWSKTGKSNTLNLPMNTLKGTADFRQSGKNVQITLSKKYRFSGVVQGNVLSYKRTHSKGGTVIKEEVKITFPTGAKGTGISNWTITNKKVKGQGIDEYIFNRAH
ncbi:MAG: hypothetical protein HUN05_19375 [Desulfobacter sp.]|nr:MAG: hypothetical protein HUN05_19375 [Desulfobacter sp.]